MAAEIGRFATFLRDNLEEHLDMLVEAIVADGPSYEQDPQTREKIRASYSALLDAFAHDDMENLLAFARRVGQERARDGFNIKEVLNSFEVMRDHVWKYLEVFMEGRDPWPLSRARRLEDFIHTFILNIAASFGSLLEETRADMQVQSEQLDAQNRTIRELGTPIIPVHEGVLVLPLVGVLDSYRASQVMEKLLEAITDYQADLVIIDITGVPVVDTSVANYLLQAARATKLVGARVILVGIGSEIAQTMVHLGVDMSDIVTLANLQEGLQYAFERLGLSLVDTQRSYRETDVSTSLPLW